MNKGSKEIWSTTLPILRAVILENRIFLTEGEQQVLMFIFHRTRMYAKIWERIPLRHFTNGVWSQGAGNTCPRLRMKSNTVIASLRHLRKKGIIDIRDHATESHEYRVCEPHEIVRHDIMGYITKSQPALVNAILLELRRNSRNLPSAFKSILDLHGAAIACAPGESRAADAARPDIALVPRGISLSPSGGIHPTNKQICRLKRKTHNLALRGKVGGKLRIIPLQTAAASCARRRKELNEALLQAFQWQDGRRKHRVSRLNFPAIERIWDESMQTDYPDGYVKLPDSAFRNFKLLVQKRGLPQEHLPELIAWIIRSWAQLRVTTFSYDGKPYGPTIPDVYFLIKRLPQIYKSFLHARELASSAPRTSQSVVPARVIPISHEDFEASRKRSGLPRWDEDQYPMT